MHTCSARGYQYGGKKECPNEQGEFLECNKERKQGGESREGDMPTGRHGMSVPLPQRGYIHQRRVTPCANLRKSRYDFASYQ
nr:hypothetical protein [Candidatus Electrothrix aestuarii]